MSAPDFEAADQAWTQAIDLAPDNSPAWSNRGTLRLQNGRWQAAKDDLKQAVTLEKGDSAVLLNNLGNAEGALGEWSAAQQHYRQAAEDPEMEAIALANLALASFELQQDEEAIRIARSLLRRDASFLDARCALAAFLWASGDRAAAEGEWEQLQNSQDGLGAAVYSKAMAVARVRNRWPPRATAALRAFLSMSGQGEAEGYDREMHKYKFKPA